LLSAQFQGFCRELHDECVSLLVQWGTPAALQSAFEKALVLNRKLDTGNPNPGNIGSDFNRLGVTFWDRVHALDARNASRLRQLEGLNDWRNAIAHQQPSMPAWKPLHLHHVREWRRACENLALGFDEVMRSYIESITGTSPW
jgi:hypothetical protein